MAKLLDHDLTTTEFPPRPRTVTTSREQAPQQVTSKGLCQQERGADALVLVFVVEDGEEDTVHRGPV
jgi:hypothetical protein